MTGIHPDHTRTFLSVALRLSRQAAVAAGCLLLPLLADCVPSDQGAKDASQLRKNAADSLTTGAQCTALRPPTKPDLFGWDPGSRGEVATIAREGLIVVKYEKRECDVLLLVLSNCTSKKATYKYAPYTESQTRIADSDRTLYANFPLAAASLRGKMSSGKGIRADYKLVGIESIPIGTVIERGDLTGSCEGATHVVRAIHRGVFAMGAAESLELAADGTLLGGELRKKIQVFDSAGTPSACEGAGSSLVSGCDVPLRLELIPLATAQGTAGGTTPSETNPPSPGEPKKPAAGGADDSGSLEKQVADERQRATKNAAAFESLKSMAADPAVSPESKMALLDKFIADVGEESELGKQAVSLRFVISTPPDKLRNVWVAAGFGYPLLGGFLEVGRFRWEHFQMDILTGYGGAGPDGEGFYGAGIAGLGAKTSLSASGSLELGFMTWPLSASLYIKKQSYEDYSTLATPTRSARLQNFGFANTRAYFAFNMKGWQFATGVQLPLVWYGETVSSTGKQDSGVFSGSPPWFWYLSAGY